MLTVYADGSSSGGKNKPGGYGWLIVRDDAILLWGYGGSPSTTNNLAETEGAIQGLEALLASGLRQPGEMLELCSDSQYALNTASGGWHASTNLDQVQRLQEAAKKAGVNRYRWVKGHAGHKYNEICDQLAHEGKLANSDPLLRDKHTKKKEKKARARKRRGLDETEANGTANRTGPGTVVGSGLESGGQNPDQTTDQEGQDPTRREGG